MHRYKVRVYTGEFDWGQQALMCEDYTVESPHSFDKLLNILRTRGFEDPKRHRRWIMPGSIVWVELLT